MTRKKGRLIFACLLLFGVVMGLYAFLFEPYQIELTRHPVKAKLLRPIKIMQLTDLHIRSFGKREKTVLELVKSEKPDLIAVTGDYAAPGRNDEATVEFFSNLKAPLGIFVISGNWEYQILGGVNEKLRTLSHVHLFDNSSQEIVPGLWLIGLDDYLTGSPRPSLAFRDVPKDAFRLLMIHSPGAFDDETHNYDLAIAGHTHGGQIRLPLLPALTPPGSGRYVAGWYEGKAGKKLYVSRGVGNSLLDARFRCPPEVTVFELGE